MYGLERDILEFNTMNGARKCRYAEEERDKSDDGESDDDSDDSGKNVTLMTA